MTASCGIHVDSRSFHLVALEGNAKKHRITVRVSGELPADEETDEALSEALRQEVREHKLRPENVVVALDSGPAAFRNLTLPFDDRSKIEEVIKYEVENDFPQWNIEDVIVDFLVLSTKPGAESNLLVIGVPKPYIARQLRACEKGGLEASEAELDGTALFNAAHAGGLLTSDAAQVLVHVGDASTTVVVVDGGRIASMRAIRAGSPPPSQSASEPQVEPGEGVEGAPASEEPSPERAADTARRIRRELARTISGAHTLQPITAIYVCGHPISSLEQDAVFDVAVLPWPELPGPNGPEGPEGIGNSRHYVLAYGAALQALGAGAIESRLRREDLRYSGRFERLELPLAVLSLLLCTLLAVMWIITEKQIDWRDEGDLAKNLKGDMQLWMSTSNAYLLPDPEKGYTGRLKDPPPALASYMKQAEEGKDQTRSKYEELQEIRRQLFIEVDKLKRELGQVSDIKQPQSALRAATLVMNVIDESKDELGRFAIRGIEANYQQGNQRQPDSVEVRLDMDFFAESDVEASRHYNSLQRAIQGRPWCLEFPDRPTKPFENGQGLSVDGITIRVNLESAEEKDA